MKELRRIIRRSRKEYYEEHRDEYRKRDQEYSRAVLKELEKRRKKLGIDNK